MQGDVPADLRRYFTTGVAGITTQGRDGPNIMSAEWTFHISYDPFLIAVFIDPTEATHGIVAETKEFGVNFWAEDQAILSSAAGRHTMRNVSKLPNPIFKIYKASRINAPMIEGCVLNAECKLVASYKVGDHTMYVGEVLTAKYDENKKPLLLRGASGYHQLGPGIKHEPFMYVFASLRKGEGGTLINVEGRVFGAKESEKVMVSVQNIRGENLASHDVTTALRGFFSSSLQLSHGIPKEEYTVKASYGDLTASCAARPNDIYV